MIRLPRFSLFGVIFASLALWLGDAGIGVCPVQAKPSATVQGANSITSDSLLTNYRQIVIEGLVLEVDSSLARQWGIEMFFTRNDSATGNNFAGAALQEENATATGLVPRLNTSGSPSVGSEARPLGIGATFDGFKTDTGTFQTTVRAAVGKGRCNILSQPIAVAMTGNQVTLTTLDEIPFPDILTRDRQPAVLDLSNKKVGITLEVVPTLRPQNDRITLDIKNLTVGQVTGYVTVSGVSRPSIQTSQVNTRIDLSNNESLLISGIKAARDRTERRGVPLLKDIPVLGLLFGRQTHIQERVDILFMITPHLLHAGENPLLPREFKNRDAIMR